MCPPSPPSPTPALPTHLDMKVLMISDSRGRRLQTLIEAYQPTFEIRVLVYPGAGIELAVLRAIPTLKLFAPDLVLVFAGVCDLTWKNRQTKVVGLKHSEPLGNVQQVMGALRASHELLTTLGMFKISYVTLTGLDLTDCNYRSRPRMSEREYESYNATKKVHRDQAVLNSSVIQINKLIVRFNKSIGSKTTWLAGLVHTYTNKSYHHHYRRLADGCHPTDKTAQAWANQIVKSVTRLMALPNNK